MEFIKKHGHSDVPINYVINKQLGSWIGIQRRNYKNKKLSHQKINLLNKVGFKWDFIEEKWKEKYDKLVLFKKKYGHCNASSTSTINQHRLLGTWAVKQRIAYNKNNLSQKKIKLLNKIGFYWEPIENRWEAKYNDLIAFKEKYKHCNVPKGFVKDKLLASWVRTQRQQYKEKKLSLQKIKSLNKIGFDWNPIESYWIENYNLLISFKNKFGSCDVPKEYRNAKSLMAWIINQRQNYKNKKLSNEKINLLNKIGFDWNPIENSWKENYDHLISFKNKFGSCNVPSRFSKNNQLRNWISTQRQNYKNKKLSQDKIKLLDKINFIWDPNDEVWSKNYNKLIAFKKQFGHCDARARYIDKSLELWVYKQRRKYKDKSLSQDKIKLLNKIDFKWKLS